MITHYDDTEVPDEVAAMSGCLATGAGLGAPDIPCTTFKAERYNFACGSCAYTCWMIYCTGCSKTAA